MRNLLILIFQFISQSINDQSQIKSLILIIFIFSTSTLRGQDIGATERYDSLILASKKYSFYNCSNSNVPLFNMPANSVLEIELRTDFEKIFQTSKSEQSRIEGILSYTFKGNKVDLPVKIKARGKTRFVYCEYKPLDIKLSSSVQSTLFDGIGEKFYITTHCGEKNGEQWILKGTESEHRNRLLAEYYMYSMLETLGTITCSASLCKIKYINNEDHVLAEEFAFIVEHAEDLAKRCRLIKNKKEVHYIDKASLINTNLMNHFITNYDWELGYSDTTGWIGHNIEFLKSNDNTGYLYPYDFDLNAITYPEYWKNKSESFDEHCYLFQEMLTNSFSDRNKFEAPYQIFINIPAFRIMITDSYMDDPYKQRFLYWLDSYEFILACHLSKYKKYKKRIY